MPKQKTHSGLKKRIKVTGTGKLKRGHAYTGHLKTNKTHKENKNLSKQGLVDKTDAKRIKSLISNMR
ncbi:MAG: 50S ribosomal protein L35 [Acholeplasmatales bacterium]|jgi:large subunit ribosomal protein L35|nr:50S ribosomal protein L35 [Acholeplasmatales bacterium]